MRVVFVGDSITASTDCQTQLPDVEAVNLAVPGFTTADVQRHLPRVTARDPDLVVLMIGTNDLGGLDRDPVEIARDIERLVEQLLHDLPETRLIINAIMPRDPYWTPSIRLINVRLAAACSHRRMSYLDTWAVLASPDRTGLDPRYLLDDGFDVHINDDGYAAWWGVLRPAILAGSATTG